MEEKENTKIGSTIYLGSATDILRNGIYDGVDCSGLVSWTLRSLKYQISGLKNSIKLNDTKVPDDTSDWLLYTPAGRYPTETGIYRDPKGTQNFEFERAAAAYSPSEVSNNSKLATKNLVSGVTCSVNGGASKKINVLKVNDPISSNYRYYNYNARYDEQGNLVADELPMGTIIVSYAGQTGQYASGGTGKQDHAWIYIGDLGTADRDEAIVKLKEMGILPDDGTKDYRVKVSTEGSTHWRIESHGNGASGDPNVGGVWIDNGDPEIGQAIDNDGKVIGAIWAFQVADDYEMPKEFDLSLKKIITSVDGKELAESVRSMNVDASNLLDNSSTDATYNMRKTPVEVKLGSTVSYKMQIFNETKDLDGYAKEITDYIPEGMKVELDKEEAREKNAKYRWKLYKANGIEAKWTEASFRSFVSDLYQKLLNKTATESNLQEEVEKYFDNNVSIDEIVYGIINSEEYKNRNTSNEEFVKSLYKAILLRNENELSNDESVTNKINKLNNNSKTRDDIVADLLDTTEFINIKYKNTSESELEQVICLKTNYLKDTLINKMTSADSLVENSKYVEVYLTVKNSAKGILTNISEISEYGYSKNNKYVSAGIEGVDRDSRASNVREPDDRTTYWGGANNNVQNEPANYPGQEDDDDFEKVFVNLEPDLSLKKTIVKVEDANGVSSKDYTRFNADNNVSVQSLKNREDRANGNHQATYLMDKNDVEVTQGDYVTYRIYVFNEGDLKATASEIKDCFLSTTFEFDSEDSINKKYGWSATTDTNTNVTTATTTYLNDGGLLHEFDSGKEENGWIISDEKLYYSFVEIRLKVKDDVAPQTRITNIAHISQYKVEKDGKITTIEQDMDSTQNNVNLPNGETEWSKYLGNIDSTNKGNWEEVGKYDTWGQEDDDDWESIIVNKREEFDLALRKYISGINGKDYTFWGGFLEEKIPEIDIRRLKANNTAGYNHDKYHVIVENGDIVTYTIRVYNEGDILGYAKEITDYLPVGLEFIPDDALNKNWEMYDATGNKTTDVSKATHIKTKAIADNVSNAIEPFTKNNTLRYEEYKVNLKVNVADTSTGKDITNRAAITKDIAYSKNGTVLTNVTDRDSEPEALSITRSELINTFYNNNVTMANSVGYGLGLGLGYVESRNYYLGEQDDDDFDTIYVKPTSNYQINLLKVNKEDINKNINEITGINSAKFEIVEVDYNTKAEIGESKTITTTTSLQEIIKVNKCKIQNKYAYKLTETEAPDGYKKLFQVNSNGKMVDVPLYVMFDIDENGSVKNLEVKVAYKEFEKYFKVNENGNTINLIVANSTKEFDLSLRKYITAVNTEKIDTRYPVVEALSIPEYRRNDTLAYFHTKEALEVKKGDIVTYTIRVYNEAEVSGYATKIRDYIPAGLEFESSTVDGIDYKWTVQRDSNGNIIKEADGSTKIETSYLADKLLKGGEAINNLLNMDADKTWSREVKVKCRVVAEPKYNEIQYLTNRAEIAEHKAVSIDENNVETVLNIEDRDSTPGDVKAEHGNNMFNYDDKENYSNNKYYPGLGYETIGEKKEKDYNYDDNDKETVYIKPITNIEFKINKLDNVSKEGIEGAKFKVTPVLDGKQKLSPQIDAILDGNGNRVQINDEQFIIPANGVKLVINSVEVNNKYLYLIEEKEAPEGYSKNFKKLVLEINVNMVDGEIVKEAKIFQLEYITYVEENGNIVSSEAQTSYASYGIEGIATLNNANAEIVIDIENKNNNKFDLALRKYITNVSNAETGKNENYNREPTFNVESFNKLENEGTAYYFHDKDAVTVEEGDIVTYTIRVYNEGDINGKATEITDYLPAGLEFIPNDAVNAGWKMYDIAGNETTDATRVAYIKTTALNNTELTGNVFGDKNSNNWYADVKVKCKVVIPTSEQDKFLTNRAEITAHEDEYGNKYGDIYEESKNTDRDSIPDTIKGSLNLDNHYNNEVIVGNPETSGDLKYYPGEQDDDDFETVVVKAKTKFEVQVFKYNIVDDSPFTDEINFKLEEIKADANINAGIKPEDILSQRTVGITGTGKLTEKLNIPVNTEYRYRISEIIPESLKTKYKSTTKSAIIKVKVSEDAKVSVILEKWEGNDTNTRLQRDYFNVSMDLNNQKQVNVYFKNEPIAKYNVVIEKVDENGETITGNTATFTQDGKINKLPTGANGIATVDENHEINKANDVITYVLREEKAPTGYGKFEGRIELKVVTTVKNDNYAIDENKSNIKVIKTVNGIDEEETFAFNEMGDDAGLFLEEGVVPTIKLKVKNPQTHGKYSIEAVKVDKNGVEIRNNKAVFIVNNRETQTNDEGIATIVSDKNISQVGQNDLYDISEKTAPTGYVAFDGKVVLSIVSKVLEGNVYGIDKENSVVSITKENGIEVKSLAYFDGLNGAFPEGLDATVCIDRDDVNKVKVLVKNIPQGNYKVELEKVDDNGQTITNSSARFAYKYNNSSRMGYVNTLNGTGIANVGVVPILRKGQSDVFEFVEVNAPSGYKKYDGKIVLRAATKLENDEYKLDAANTKLYAIKTINGEKVQEEISLGQIAEGKEVGFEISGMNAGGNNNSIPTIKIKVKNTPVIGKLNVKLVKVDGNGNVIKNNPAKFIVNRNSDVYENPETTNANGELVIAENVDITEQVAHFIYKVKEKEAPNGYTLFDDEIKLNIWTKEQNEQYKVNQDSTFLQVGSTYKPLSNFNGEFEEGQYVTAKVDETENGTTIEIRVKNILEGKYNVQLVKVDEKLNPIVKLDDDENELESGKASFNVDKLFEGNTNNKGTLLKTSNGILKVAENREITSATANDIYLITEANAPEGYKKYDGQIKVSAKFKLNDGKFVLDKNNTKVTADGVDVKVNGITNQVGYEIVDGEIPTIKVKVVNIPVNNKYKMKIIKVDENGNQIESSNTNDYAQFAIEEGINNNENDRANNKETYTATNGVITLKEKAFTEQEQHHLYKITETKAPKGYAIYENEILVNVYAKQEGNSYVINTNASVVDAGADGVYSLSNKKQNIEEGKSVIAYVEEPNENENVPVIVVKVKNTPLKGKFNLKVKKVNSLNNSQNVDGVVFTGFNSNKKQITTFPTKDGITEIDSDVDITSEGQIFQYVINEKSVPQGYTKLNDYGIKIVVSTKISDDKKSYVVNNVTAEPIELEKTQFTEFKDKERKMLENGLACSVQDGVITVTVPNEPTSNYKLAINKIDSEISSEFVENARFTIEGPNGMIQEDAVLRNAEDLLGRFVTEEENVRIGKTYSYTIKETFAPVPYENVFKIGDVYLPIKVDIFVDENGNVSQRRSKVSIVTEGIDLNDGDTYAQYVKALEHIGNLTFENNTVSLDIKNPKMKSNFELDLFKHQLGNEEKGIEGAKFKVETKNKDDEEWTVVNDAENPLLSSEIEDVLIAKVTEASVNSVYYYNIEEIGVPNNNYLIGKIKAVVIRVTVSENAEVNAEILTVKLLGGDTFIPYNEADHGNDIKLKDEGNNKYVLKLPNSTRFTVELMKRIDRVGDNDYETVNGGNFNVYEVTRDGMGTPTANLVSGPAGIGAPWNYNKNDANPNSSYEYWIDEITAPDGLNNDFTNVTIQLILKTDNEGNVLEVGPGGSIINFLARNDKSELPGKIKTLLYGKTRVRVDSNNHVQLDVKDTEVVVESDKYGIQIIKVDNENRATRIKDVEFGVLVTSNGAVRVAYDADSETAGVQNPVTDGNGIINISDINIIEGNTDIFEITELTNLPEYQNLNGVVINARVDLTGITKQTQITDDKVTISLSGPNASLYPDGFVTATVENGIIKIVVPNKPNKYQFVINKTDELGNLIKADKADNGSYDGASIGVFELENDGEGLVRKYLIQNSVLEDGTRATFVNCKANTEYEYHIEETQSKVGYVNVLKGYEIVLKLVTNDAGEIKEIRQDDENYSRYTIAQSRNPHDYRMPLDTVNECVNISINWVDIPVVDENGNEVLDEANNPKTERVQQLAVNIKNPKAYSFRLSKCDTKGAEISQVIMSATLVKNGVETTAKINLNNQSTTLQQGLNIVEGERQVWRIREETVNIPYYNVLKNGAYVDVTVECLGSSVHVVDTKAYNQDGSELNLAEGTVIAEKEAKKVNNQDVISVKLVNPMQYYIGVDKVIEDINGNFTSLKGAGIKVSALTTDRNGNLNSAETTSTNGTDIKIHQIADLGQVYTYRIEETSAPVGHINVFEGKFIEFYAYFNSVTKKPEVSNVAVYINNNGSRGELIDVNDDIYNYISFEPITVSEENGIYYIKVNIINPIEYDVTVTKVKTDTNKTELPGAEIELNNKIVIANGASSYITSDTLKINEEKTYTLKELSAPGNHANILTNLLAKVKVKLVIAENGEEKLEIISKELYYKSGNRLQTEAEKAIFSYVSVIAEKDAVTGKNTLKVVVQNPVQTIFVLKKVKTDNETGLYGAILTYNDKKAITANEVPEYQTYMISKVGDVRTIDIKELSTKDDYINVLEGDKILRIKVKMNETEQIEILSTTIVENVDGQEVETPLSEYEKLKDYIEVKKSYIIENNVRYESIEVRVQNPRKYKFRVSKVKSDGKELLTGAIIKVDGKTVMSGTEAVYEETLPLNIFETHTITVEEDSTKPGYVNILKGKKLVVTATVLADESIVATKKLVTNDANQTEITDKNILKYFDVQPTTSGVQDNTTVRINIINPEEFNLRIVKVDKDTNERMNNVKFDVSVFDENNEEVKLKDSNTFENKNLSGLVTSNVNGEDGIIEIKNILIEKVGTFKFKFHETQKYGYISIPDITAEVKIENVNGNYVVKSIQIVDGNDYVNNNEVKVITNEPETIQVEIDNQQVKGKYDITLNKVDKVTLKKLNGAKFDISAEKDGNKIELYKQTADVKSKDVVIPSQVTVTNGCIVIKDIRIDREESYTIKLTETSAPSKYLSLDTPIELKVTTKIKNEKYVLDNVELVTASNLVTKLNDENRIEVTVKNEQFDLALRKYVSKVITNEGKDDEKVIETKGREPQVITEGLKNKKETTAVYNQDKTPVSVFKGDTVIYTIRVYNEGDTAGYAKELTDHLPEYLEFVNDEFNSKYGWVLDSSDKSLRTVRTNYLSKEYDEEANLIKPFNNETGEIFYKEVLIKCKVKDSAKVKTEVTNLADITISTDDNGNTVTDRDSTGDNVNVPEDSKLPSYKDSEIEEGKPYIPGQEDDDDFEKVIIEEFDLALRKFITGVTKGDGTKDEITSRIPVFKVDDKGNYIYEHTKEPVTVANQNIVEYTLRVFNEGTIDGYAKEVKDDIPEGLEFLPDDSINKEFRWIMLDENGNKTDNVNEAKYIATDYLSKEQEKKPGDNLIKSFDIDSYNSGTIKEPNYKDVKVAFKVTLPDTSDEIVVNKAQISKHSDSKGKDITDKDSTPDVWVEGEDDQDIEKIKVQYFDLSLRKWVSKAIVIKDGKQEVRETGHKAEDDPEDVVKVDLEKSKLDNVVVKFEYKIRVTNEGQIPGYVKEISDYIPDGLKFVPADNPNWSIVNGKVTTDELKDTLLNKGESAEVTIILTWINRKDNMGLKVNTAEISKDYNEYGSPDVDSTPNNKVPGEDDIDDAPVMITVKTGEEAVYIGITLSVLVILACGVVLVKKFSKE